MTVEAAGAFAGQHVLITGATGGIGSILAAKLAREGCRISAVNRQESRLKDLKNWLAELGGECNVIPMDLSMDGYPEKAVEKARAESGPIQSAFLLAGDLPVDKFESLSVDKILSTIKLNLVSPIIIIKKILADMLKRDSGRICAVSSTAGYSPIPFLSVYNATKAGIAMFCKSVANELADSGVTVTCVLPRAVDTAMINDLKPSYRRLGWAIDSPEKVAEKILRATALGKIFEPMGLMEKFAIKFERLIPGLFQKEMDLAKEIFESHIIRD